MAFCPQCRRTAPSGEVKCAVCGTRLLKSPPRDPDQGELFEAVELFDVPDEITGMALRSFLADQGVEANLRELQASFYGTTLNPGGGLWAKLVVPKEQEAKARELIERFLAEFHGR